VETTALNDRIQRLLGLALALAMTDGCQARPPQKPAATPTTSQTAAAPTSRAAPVSWEKRGIKLTYPPPWKPKQSNDYELMLVPAGASADEPRITMDIPVLPPHMPWMIQMSRMEQDYLADLKKSYPDVKLIDATDVKIPHANARLVRASWHQGNIVHDDVALLMIHANSVYILDARADEKYLASTRKTFDAVQASIQWSK
jgi:hypothetical protein